MIAHLVTQLGYPTTAIEMRERFQNILAHPDYRTFVAESMGTGVGFVGACINYAYEQNAMYGRLVALSAEEH